MGLRLSPGGLGVSPNLLDVLLHNIATFILISVTVVLSIVPGNTGICAEMRSVPNVVIILTDDQGWGDLSVNGNSNLATPRIDSLARSGVLLERFFVCPVCSPIRAEFLTGRYHPRGGVYAVSTGGERLNPDEKTIADTFKAAGYATGAFGKWHNGSQWPYHPNARGFDEYYGFTSGLLRAFQHAPFADAGASSNADVAKVGFGSPDGGAGLLGLKGHNTPAQGNALGQGIIWNRQPCKGEISKRTVVCFTLSGLRNDERAPVPRALPWADEFKPFRLVGRSPGCGPRDNSFPTVHRRM